MKARVFVLDYLQDNRKVLTIIRYKVGNHSKTLCKGIYDFSRDNYQIIQESDVLLTPQGIELLYNALLDQDWENNISISCKLHVKHLKLLINRYKQQINHRI